MRFRPLLTDPCALACVLIPPLALLMLPGF